ncbi:MAG TPA: hypothetical protein VGH74_10380, partial [Planctomycetaceae bacterium]
KPSFKQAIDKLAEEIHMPLADVKSVTMGLSGVPGVDFAKMMPGMPGMGMPGGAAGGANAPGKVHGLLVVRVSKALPADFTAKLTGYEAATHQGATYHRPAGPGQGMKPSVQLAAPDIVLVGEESDIKRAIEQGSKQVRRAEFDFIETSPQLVIAMLNKNSGAGGAPAGGMSPGGMPPGGMAAGGMPPGGGGMAPGGMPGAGGMPGGGMPGGGMPGGGMPGGGMPGGGMPGGGMPGGGMPGGGMPGGGMPGRTGGAPGLGGLAASQSLTNGKIKGWYVGISFTQDIEIQTGLDCPDSAKEALADVERELTKQKNEFPAQKAQLTMMLGFMQLGDMVPHIESMVNSMSASGTAKMVTVNIKIPGGIAATIEKAATTMMGMAGLGAGGNPFGGPPGSDPGSAPGSDAGADAGSDGPPADGGAPGGDEPATSQNSLGNP